MVKNTKNEGNPKNDVQNLKRPNKIMLDVCCGPCSTHVINELIQTIVQENGQLTLYFSNDNVYPIDEFEKRFLEAKKVAEKFNLQIIKKPYDHDSWLGFIRGLEQELESGKRCVKCFEYRIDMIARYASSNGFDAITTTLTVSPHKKSKIIFDIGKNIAQKYGLILIESDFKKKDGFKKSIELSNELGLYRQGYCGCEFSMRQKK
jgi:hypothetical protein